VDHLEWEKKKRVDSPNGSPAKNGKRKAGEWENPYAVDQVSSCEDRWKLEQGETGAERQRRRNFKLRKRSPLKTAVTDP